MSNKMAVQKALSLYQLTVQQHGKRLFIAYYAPVFPHIKNIYESFYASENADVTPLINKLTTKWESTAEYTFRQIVIANQKKYTLFVNEIPKTFHSTVPIWLAAYEGSKNADK